jgi:hypothetical protein
LVPTNDQATIKTADGKSMSGIVEKRDLANDLAMVRVDNVKDPAKECPGLPIADSHGKLFDDTIAVAANREPAYFGGRVGGLYKRGDVRVLEALPGEDLERQMLAVKMRTGPGAAGAVLANSQRQATGLLETEINGIVLAQPSGAMKAFVEDLKRSKQQ